MAGGGVVVQGGRNYEGGVTPFVMVTCLVAAMGGLLFGYDLGISGGVTSMPSFLAHFFPSVVLKMKSAHESEYCKFDSELLTLFTSSLYLAALVASFGASIITRKFGRKPSMFFGGLSFLIGSILNGVANSIVLLIIGRLLLGVGVGFANQVLSEMAPTKIRGALNMGFQMAITIGILVANLVNVGTAKIEGGWGWRVSLALAAVPAVMMTVGAMFLPDTPNSILERGYKEEAKIMLQKVRGTQLVMCALIPFFQQLTGINVIMFYAPVLFKTLGFGDDASLISAVISGGVNVLATLVSIFTVDKFGRRILFLEGGAQMFVCQILVGSLIGVKFGLNGEGTLTKLDANLILLLVCVYVSAFAWSWGPLGWLVPSEICPLEIRSAGQSINVAVNMFFTFIIAQVFLSMLCHMKFGLFYFFAGFVAIMTVFIYFFLPETKNVPIEEMNRVWKAHWFWSKYIPDEVVIGGHIQDEKHCGGV